MFCISQQFSVCDNSLDWNKEWKSYSCAVYSLGGLFQNVKLKHTFETIFYPALEKETSKENLSALIVPYSIRLPKSHSFKAHLIIYSFISQRKKVRKYLQCKFLVNVIKLEFILNIQIFTEIMTLVAFSNT